MYGNDCFTDSDVPKTVELSVLAHTITFKIRLYCIYHSFGSPSSNRTDIQGPCAGTIAEIYNHGASYDYSGIPHSTLPAETSCNTEYSVIFHYKMQYYLKIHNWIGTR